jgi:hypothetical protein
VRITHDDSEERSDEESLPNAANENAIYHEAVQQESLIVFKKNSSLKGRIIIKQSIKI